MREPKAQSYFKHRFLKRYVNDFAFKLVGSGNSPILIVDGFAGPGRYEDGTVASAQMMIELSQLRSEFSVRLIEKRADYASSLRELVAEATKGGRGSRVQVLEGSASKHLPTLMAGSKTAHVFLYLDPCGYGLSFEELIGLFDGRPEWPRTEMMLNFSADLVRRLGGSNFKGRDEAIKLTAACGGDWWVDLARPVVERDGNWSGALGLVMQELANRLAAALGRYVFTAPIRADRGHEPKFHMVCATSSGHGLLSLSHSFAFAWDEWAAKLDDANSGQEDLFGEMSGAGALRSGRDVLKAKQQVREDVMRFARGTHVLGSVAQDFLGRSMGHLKEGELRSAFKEMDEEGLIHFTSHKQLGQSKFQIARG